MYLTKHVSFLYWETYGDWLDYIASNIGNCDSEHLSACCGGACVGGLLNWRVPIQAIRLTGNWVYQTGSWRAAFH